ncbi:dTDP-4-dehydrorhamnose reductase [Martelella mediterranea]|uniref:dTDP-4-dehydrorhamnose reductase n=1 Tax=Martelella mediterranea TaxID=293089 RepID=UPI001E46711F|nr:dTDP-4-dehydrorhamnose reductase [Martelella mediterranea]MCD1633131.1 dTDP-4-dehydrorhamnose reductase [Martelella mediterranea]
MILVFGQSGQVATELKRILPDALFLSRHEADLTNPAACAAAIAEHRPAAVINAAAYTAVDKAESDEETALNVNATAPGAMARAAAELGIPFVHISTDYVFAGTGEKPFSPDDPTAPLGAYGRTKLAGEQLVARTGGPFAILRTSWVFSAHGGNFVKTMLRLAESRDSLTIVADQIGGPTSARAIALACKVMAEQLIKDPAKSGIYHFSGAPDTSWADFARAIFEMAGRAVTVTDIATSDYPTPAARPLNSRLDCSTLSAFGLARPDWRTDLAHVLTELGAIS